MGRFSLVPIILTAFSIIFYGNIYIALCALSLSLQSALFLDGLINYFLLAEIFFATLSVYSIHRLIGLKKIKKNGLNERFIIIQKQQKLLLCFSIFAAAAALLFFFYLNFNTRLALILSALPSLGYIMPLLGNKRLRDIPYLKIFLIAAVWSFVTVFLPWLESGRAISGLLFLLILERATFVFAITIPFDIRDMEIEKNLGVNTIPSAIGIKKSLILSVSILTVWAISVFLIYPYIFALTMMVVFVISIFLVLGTAQQRPDYYYTAFLDGTLLLYGVLGSLSIIFGNL